MDIGRSYLQKSQKKKNGGSCAIFVEFIVYFATAKVYCLRKNMK